MGKVNTALQPETFNYGLFQSDVNAFCIKEKETIIQISRDVLIRSDDYLARRIRNKNMPLQIAMAVAQHIGQPLSKYKREEPLKPAEEPKPAQTAPASPYGCEVLVNDEFGFVAVKVIKDGKELVNGHASILEKSDRGVLRAIAAAFQMTVRITDYRERKPEQTEPTKKPETSEVKPTITPYREWMKKFAYHQTDIGNLARFIQNNPNFSNNPKFAREYLSKEPLKAYLPAFEKSYALYEVWLKNAEANNVRTAEKGN